jgi:hypothetical protein
VIVQNAGQVNIASDGGQQVNINSGKKGTKKSHPGLRSEAASTTGKPSLFRFPTRLSRRWSFQLEIEM